MSGIHIAHIESSMDWGGQELRVVEQTEWLNARDYPTTIIARPRSKILEKAQKRGLPTFALPLRGSLHPSTLLTLLRFLKLERIDVLDCHGSRDSFYGALVKALTSVAVIRSRHVTDPIKDSGTHGFVWRHGNHGVLVTAAKIREMLIAQKLANPERITAVPAGVDPARFHPNVDASDLRKELGIDSSRTVIANIGMIRPDKGQLYFVEVARALLKDRENSSENLPLFIQVGEATTQTAAYREEVLNAAGDALGRDILFLGYQDDIERYLALADIVVIASIGTEAQTRLIAQVALMRRNIIATRVGGLPEMITDGETGVLCAPGNVDALSDAVRTLLSSPPLAAKLRDAAFERAQREMTFEHMMSVMLEAYRRAIARTGRTQ
ncbi:MAG: glycosyltransferase family 4 protein [Burkholderiales bacterium]|jgi:glycosyltransferase involved in cell wall biosynthesis|nr:glycosyltransferase family 4 protein [Burkholderiales bacterium]